MSLQTYADIQTSIANWLHRSDLGSVIPDFISLGEDRIYRNLRVRQMEDEIDDTIDADGTWTAPVDYVDLKFLYVNASPIVTLERKPAEWVYKNDPNRTSGIPRYIAREADHFIFAPFPASEYAIKGVYYKRLDSIADDTNDIFEAHPGLWLFASLIESAPYVKNDGRLTMWESKFAQLVSEVNAEEYRENASGSRLQMRG